MLLVIAMYGFGLVCASLWNLLLGKPIAGASYAVIFLLLLVMSLTLYWRNRSLNSGEAAA